MDENLRDQIQYALTGQTARYIEIRFERSQSSRIQYRGKELEQIARTTGIGGCVRAFTRGGWSFVSFNELENLREKVSLAVDNANRAIGENPQLADIDPVIASIPPTVKKDPTLLSLGDKKALLDQYLETLWDVDGIASSMIGYSDGRRDVIFANSEGSYIEQSKVDLALRVNAVAKHQNDVQQSGISLGSNGDYSSIEGLHDQVTEVAKNAVALLAAPEVKGGEYTVILDPVLAGVFIHEAFGHLSEADHIYEDERLKQIMVLGRRFGESHLNVIDGAAIPGLRGSYQYDDEGVPTTRTQLLQEGKLVGRLHSRETAAKLGETPTGNARAINYQFPPIVRMTNTFIEPGSATFNDLLSSIRDGVYVCNWYGGMTSMEQFTFSAGEAYMIRNGCVQELLRPVMLSGNVFTTLENLDGVANDLEMNEGGGCGKGGQSPLPVSNGSPHIRIQQCLVIGRE